MENKKKRGRPTIAARYGMDDVMRDIKNLQPGKSERHYATEYYIAAVTGLLNDANLERVWRYDPATRTGRHSPEILEQLGRMREQDGYSDADVLTVARIADEALKQGAKVKTVKAYIIHGRKTGEW